MKLTAYVLLLVIGAIWGSHFVLNEVAIRSLPPVTIATLRALFGAITLAVILQVSQYRKNSDTDNNAPPLQRWQQLFFIGLFEATLPFFLMSWGQQFTESSLAAILMSTTPIYTTLLARLLLPGSVLRLGNFISLGLGCTGVIFLVGVVGFLPLTGNVLGKMALLLAAFSFALALVLIKKFSVGSPIRSARNLLFCAFLQLLPIAIFVDRPWLLHPRLDSLIAVLISGILGAGVAYTLYFILIDQKGPTFAALTNYIVPLFASLFGIVLLGEVITPSMLAALGLIIAAVAINGLTPTSSL